MFREDAVAGRLAQLRGGIDQSPVALPGLRIEYLLLLRQALLGGLLALLRSPAVAPTSSRKSSR
jgi:hypothetical protein